MAALVDRSAGLYYQCHSFKSSKGLPEDNDIFTGSKFSHVHDSIRRHILKKARSEEIIVSALDLDKNQSL
eukprot:scaffold24581_cov70-Skeletonema_dohrnii-CCMP3373.AAC.4